MPIPSKKKKNGKYHATIRDVFVCSKNELAPFATAYVFPPENFDQQKFGTLFGVIKVDDHSENSSYVVNLLTSVMKKEYFGKPHRSPEESFEASLRKANLALAELARHGATSWAGKINFAGGAVEKNNLHFTCLGKVSVFLIRGDQIVKISEELDEEKEAESHPLKTFSNTSSGKLEIGDKLIFTTDELTDIFSSEELRQNASHFSREEFPEFLEISLQANSELAGIVTIDLSESAETKPLIVEAPLIGKEKVKKIDSFVGADEITEKEEAYARGLEASSREETFFPRGGQWKNFFYKLGERSKKTFLAILQAAKNSRLKEKVSRIPEKIRPAISSTLFRIKNIDWRNRKTNTRIAVAIIVVIIGLYGIVAFVKNRNEQKRASQESTVQSPEPTPAPQSLNDVNVKNIETVEEFANLPQGASQLALLGNFIYAIPEKSNFLLKIDLNSKNIEEAETNLTVGNFRLAAAMPHLSSLFILTENNKVISFTPVNKNFQENNIALPGDLKAIDMKAYLTYLYFLDPEANQIYRYPRAEGGFGEMQSWLRSGADVKNAVSFAINEDLFAASSSDITAYLQGRKDDKISFEVPNVPLEINKIFSEPDTEGIYILDDKNRRIVRYNKQGKITDQYFNTSIVSVKDFLVDEKNKTIYLLKNNQLFKFSFE